MKKRGCLIASAGGIEIFALIVVPCLIWAGTSAGKDAMAEAEKQTQIREEERAKRNLEIEAEKDQKNAEAEVALEAKRAKEEADLEKQLISEFKLLFGKLEQIRFDPSFHHQGDVYQIWDKEQSEVVKRSQNAPDLAQKGIAFDDLKALATQWQESFGEDSDSTIQLSNRMRKSIGLEEEKPIISIFSPRTWTSADGTKSFEGTLTKLGNGEVTVLKNGEPLKFSISKLSEDDQKFLGRGITITTTNGKVFTGGAIVGVNDNSVNYQTAKGITSIADHELPDSLRWRFKDLKFVSKKTWDNQQKAVAQKLRNEKLSNPKGFSGWDGSHVKLTRMIKDQMHDPKSYKHVETIFKRVDDQYLVHTKYRGKNGFGATVLSETVAVVDYDGNVVSIVK